MKTRFEGPEGRRLLVEALKAQQIIEHDQELATEVAESGSLEQFSPGDKIITQGDTDNDVVFILQGEADVFVNERYVATREARACIGEMAVIDPSAPRSTSVVAKTPLVALKVTEPEFSGILQRYPRVWKSLALLLADRLRQRSNFHRPPNPEPVLFVGCSVEGLRVADEIQLKLKHHNIEVKVWTDGVFGPGDITIEALMRDVDSADFGAFVFAPDDKVVSRGKESDAPRDNVVFELGLFMGRLDRDRVFVVRNKGEDMKVPTDLLGITQLEYVLPASGDLTIAIAPICTELRKAVQKLGTR